MKSFDLVAHMERQQDFSMRTFGPGLRTEGLIDHIKKELEEIANNPRDLVEWVDVILLALDGAWRAGYYPEEICEAIKEKLERNMARKWPDWRTAEPDKAIEHVRESVVLGAQNGGFATAEAWYAALKQVAGAHMLASLVRDFDAWTSNWENEKPEDAFYNEYPEYRES